MITWAGTVRKMIFIFLWGRGKIDFSSILLDLKGKGYDNNITLEVKTNYLVNGKKIIEETLLRESAKK